MSLTTGVFPDTMKIAEVVPLYKGKNPYEECNYRPISLLTTMSKILEKVMYTRVYGFLNIQVRFTTVNTGLGLNIRVTMQYQK